MFNEFTTLQQMQAEIWDFYKDVHGYRPRHFTEQEWNSREFLQAQWETLVNIVDNMTPEEKIAEGWGSDADALASAGWGTDEDYGGDHSLDL